MFPIKLVLRCKHIVCKLISVLAISVFFSDQLFSQEIFYKDAKDNALDTTKGGYVYHLADSVYEGLYTKRVSRNTFELVSLTYGQILFSMIKNTDVIIHARPITPKKFKVAGRSFGLNKNFHIDFSLSNNVEKHIHLNEAIIPLNIFSENIGMFGFLGDLKKPQLLIPLKVLPTLAPDPNKLQLIIMINKSFDRIQFSYAKRIANNCSEFSEPIFLTDQDLSAYSTIKIPLDFNSKVAKGDTVCIQIKGLLKGSQKWESFDTLEVLTY